ncbi:hypothetical protein BCV73_08785 [Paenibacillus sp. SSG-1]|uniref:hypothetical protein n=1 Tax=Paenibacillus sp. SSG-1 TaxID=1443669 RepID=UPI000B7DB86B|nr:hypothetical protein [Paenibacillus sp. SSG-1]OXL83163.1 hypothetical protein BCV73_08785 [Paenibacillus sp. SSG-1]
MWQLRIYDMKHFWDKNYHLMELVKEVAEEPDKDSIYEIDGRTYRWCAFSPEHKVCGIKEITLNTEPDDVDDDYLTCPYCGSIDHDAWERSADDDTVECGSCGSTIEYQRNVQITYTVTPVKMADVIRL